MQSSWLQQASTFRQVACVHLDLEVLCEARGKSLRWLDLWVERAERTVIMRCRENTALYSTDSVGPTEGPVRRGASACTRGQVAAWGPESPRTAFPHPMKSDLGPREAQGNHQP